MAASHTVVDGQSRYACTSDKRHFKKRKHAAERDCRKELRG